MLDDHFKIAQQVLIYDANRQEDLTLKYEGSGTSTETLALFQQFPPGNNYRISYWGFYHEGNLEAYMVIAGPGVDDKTFRIEVSRIGWDEFRVTLPTGTYTFPKVTAVGTVSLGYVCVEYTPS